MSTMEILAAALSLNARQRGRLIAALIQSLESEADKPFENASEAELLRRLDTLPAPSIRRNSATVRRAVLERLHKRRR